MSPKTRAMRAISVECAAKVNLHLDVLRRLPDGYHEICTVFQRVCLFDTVTLTEAGSGIRLECDSHEVPRGEDNLAVRAAAELASSVGCRRGVLIRLTKRIPVGAGLGGGSSDAAGVLLGLNRLWELGLSRAELGELGGRLGADVPFFVSGAGAGVGRGRGDLIEPIASLSGLWFVLASLPFQVRAADAYALYERPLTVQHRDPRITLDALRHKGAGGGGNGGGNVGGGGSGGSSRGETSRDGGFLLDNALEDGVVAAHPDIGAVLESLRRAEDCLGAILSGSGPTAFGIAASWEGVRRMEAAIRKPHVRAFVVQAA